MTGHAHFGCHRGPGALQVANLGCGKGCLSINNAVVRGSRTLRISKGASRASVVGERKGHGRGGCYAGARTVVAVSRWNASKGN